MDCSAQGSLSFTISRSLPKFMSIASLMLSSHLILWHPLLLLPSIFPSIRDFSNELAVLIRWPKYWSFSFSISPSSEYSGLISLKIDWFDLLAVQRTFSINSLTLCFLYGPALTTIRDHREDHSLDYTDDTALMAESKEALETLDEGQRGELKSQIKTKY